MNRDFRYRILNSSGDVIFCSLTGDDAEKISQLSCASQATKDERGGFISKNGYTVYGFSKNSDYVASSHKFKIYLSIIADCASGIEMSLSACRESINRNTRRLLHNLTSLNAHNMQEIYSIFPQEMLSKKTSGQLADVQDIIRSDIRDAAFAFLRIDKNNFAMKTEFSVFNKLFEKDPELQRKSHNVHKVLMNVFYIFFSDFTDKRVRVVIDAENTYMAYFDYESIRVAFFYVIENSVKYTKPDSDLNVRFVDNGLYVSIIFDMISLQINRNEVSQIFEEGFSGSFPVSTGKSGGGIGLSNARSILALNGASITIEIDESTRESTFGIPYQRNVFTIDLPRKRGLYSELVANRSVGDKGGGEKMGSE